MIEENSSKESNKNSNSSNREKEKYSLLLDVTDPNKSGDNWEVTAVVTVLFHRRYAPDPPREIVFLLDGSEITRISTDDESGQATTVVNFSKPGSYLLIAFVSDFPGVRYSKRILVKAEQKVKKLPVKVMVHLSGKRGKQVLLVAAIAEDGSFIGGFTGKLKDGNNFFSFTTGSDGTYEYKTSFKEKERSFRVWVGDNPEQTWSGVLLGPKEIKGGKNESEK